MPGVLRRILSWDKEGMLVLYNIKANTVVPRHSHTNAQHGLTIKGGGTFEYSTGNKHKVTPNEAYYVPPNEEHSLLTGPEKENIFLDVFLPPREDFRKETRPSDDGQ